MLAAKLDATTTEVPLDASNGTSVSPKVAPEVLLQENLMPQGLRLDAK